MDENWPESVDLDLICNTEEDKKERANSIIDTYLCSLSNKKFLDFGCGEGHVVEASCEARLSVGYDPNIKKEKNNEKQIITNNYDLVVSNGPYDIILLYDVLDHVVNPVETLQQVYNLATSETKVYIRFHPWCSRHGGHLYRQFNKAFAHLFLSPDELNNLKLSNDFSQKVFFPIKQYNEWIEDANFKVISIESQITPVEDYFIPYIEKYNKENNMNLGKHQLQQSFVDAVICIKEKEIDTLKNLIDSLPLAVPEELIVNTTSDFEKMERAKRALENVLFGVELKNKKILDFGCGEGYFVKHLNDRYDATGFDIIKKGSLWNDENLKLFDQWDVICKSLYDIIILYDVLDHALFPEEVLIKVKSILAPNGRVYVRCHPWCSRHASHLYEKLNKAFIHLIFSEQELADMGFTIESCNKIVYPLKTYNAYFQKANLTPQGKPLIESNPVEEIFKNHPLLKKRIMQHFSENKNQFPEFQLKQNFIDFILEHSN